MATCYNWTMPTAEVDNYNIDYENIGGSFTNQPLNSLPQFEDGSNTIFALCLLSDPIFRDSVSGDAVVFPYEITSAGSCVTDGDCILPPPVEEYDLTLGVNPLLSGIVSNLSASPSPYEEGEAVILSAVPNSGFVFVNWTNGLSVVSTSPNFTFTMPAADTTLLANFEAIPPDPEEPVEDTEPAVPTPVVSGLFLPDFYENCSRFILVKNLPYNLPVGSVLDTSLFDGLDWTYIREPMDWDQVKLKMERTDDYGFTQLASVDSVQFTCVSGKNFLDQEYIQNGVDSNVKFIFAVQSFGTADFLIAVINDVNFSEYTRTIDTTTVNLESSEFNQLLRSREDVPYRYPRNLPVFLYSKALAQVTQYTRKTARLFEDTVGKPSDPNTITAAFGVFNSDPNLNEIAGAFTYPDQLTFVRPPEEDKYVLKPKLSGKYAIEIKVAGVAVDLGRYAAESSILGPTPPDPNGLGWGEAGLALVVQIYDAVSGNLKFEEISEPTNIEPSLQLPYIDRNGNEVILRYVRSKEFDKSYQFELTTNDEVYVYLRYTKPEFSTPETAWFEGIPLLKVFESLNTDSNAVGFVPSEYRPFPADVPSLKISGQTIEKASVAYQGRLFDAMDTVLRKMLGKSRQVLISNFLSEGGALHALTVGNGFSIRGAAVVGQATDSRASFKQLFQGSKALVNMGYNVEINQDGREVVRVEEMDYFFADSEIITFTEESDISQYEEMAEMEYVFNELEFGYQKFSKERETDKADTLQDSHGKVRFLTPIKKFKNKLSVVSEFVASAFEIERIRRKQFDPDSTDSNERYDNDVYMINLRNNDQVQSVIFGFQDFFSIPNTADFFVQSNGIRFINRTNLPIVQGDIVEIVYNDVSAGTREVKEVLNAPQGLSSTNYDTYVVFTQPPPSPPPVSQLELKLLLPESRYIPESTEPFENISGIDSPETHYNLRYTPKRMMKNWGKFINAGLSFKDGAENIQFQDGEGNMQLQTELSIDDPFPLGDIQRAVTQEGSDITLSQLWGRNSRFLAYSASFSVPLGYDVYNYIMRAHKGNSADPNNYGYIQVPDFKGNLIRGYLVNLEYDPNRKRADFKLLFSQRLPILEADILRPIVSSNNKTFIDQNGNYIQHD